MEIEFVWNENIKFDAAKVRRWGMDSNKVLICWKNLHFSNTVAIIEEKLITLFDYWTIMFNFR